ncbi:unnamed protein product [Nippostrongylus brasiliensis]|uniref:Uncharacterized protein n=1 Tax=Nippostrongylus brasiliensis TaxID=27835 RepID=A0A0N4YFA1_NIPBR|nr:unnamed protein product [Nippostrongylus brasiliensis]
MTSWRTSELVELRCGNLCAVPMATQVPAPKLKNTSPKPWDIVDSQTFLNPCLNVETARLKLRGWKADWDS